MARIAGLLSAAPASAIKLPSVLLLEDALEVVDILQLASTLPVSDRVTNSSLEEGCEACPEKPVSTLEL